MSSSIRANYHRIPQSSSESSTFASGGQKPNQPPISTAATPLLTGGREPDRAKKYLSLLSEQAPKSSVRHEYSPIVSRPGPSNSAERYVAKLNKELPKDIATSFGAGLVPGAIAGGVALGPPGAALGGFFGAMTSALGDLMIANDELDETDPGYIADLLAKAEKLSKSDSK
ncbi:hypothetical protein [Agarilytica rhodophyticola]|uniref:hypothetical protein n=1 Tax=Agarilytica rhodophyticola TaxID=1737490 RepID=UPI000B344CE1|nr:hypothetical protein [Agarilytica rhodophyticola]